MLTANLQSVTGPSKSVVDSGPLINTEAPIIDGLSTVFGAAEDVFKGVKTAKAKKQAKQKAQVADQRAAAREQRSQAQEARSIETFNQNKTKFEQQQEDRFEKEDLENFKDFATGELIGLSRAQTRSKQGGSADKTAFDIQSEKTINEILTRFPNRTNELAELYKEKGFNHVLFRGLEQEKARVDAEEAGKNSATSALSQKAIESGVGSIHDDPAYLVQKGQEINLIEERIKNAQVRKENSIADRTISLAERKQVLKEADRDLMESANVMAGFNAEAITKQLTEGLANVETDEQFAELTQELPRIKSELQLARQETLKTVQGNVEGTKIINDKFDQQEAYVLDLVSGDFSRAKQKAAELQAVKTSLGLRAREALPGVFAVDALPPFAKEAIIDGSGITRDSDFHNGIGDFIAGEDTEASKVYQATRKLQLDGAPLDDTGGGPDADPITKKSQRSYIKQTRHAHQAGLAHVLNSDDIEPEKGEEYLSSQTLLTQAGQRLSGTQGNVKDLNSAVGIVLAPGTQEALEKMISNPETQFQATAVMKATQQTALSFINNSKLIKDDSLHSMVFNESSGQFEIKEDPAKRQKLKDRDIGIVEMKILETPRKHVQEKVAAANRSLDFLKKTRQYDDKGSQMSESDYTKFIATGRFTPQEEPEAVKPRGNSKIEQTAILSKYRARNTEAAPFLDEAASTSGLPTSLVHAVADQETGHLSAEEGAAVTNHKSARGIMQITPITAKEMNVDFEELTDPKKNIDTGARYLKRLMRRFDGDIKDVLMAYNAGPTRIDNWIDDGRPIIEGKSWQDEAFPYADKIIERIERSSGDDK